MDLGKYVLILPGRIVTYHGPTQTATVRICVEKITQDSGTNDKLQTYKDLRNVPVHTPSGGGWSFTVPIAAGNTCILFFSQVGYDHWFVNDRDVGGKLAGMPAPHLNRSFDKNDSFALVGLNTLPRAIQDYSTTDSEWRNTDRSQVISLKANGDIDITTPGTVTVNAAAAIVNAPSTINSTLHVTGAITSDSSVTAPNVSAGTSLTIGGTEVGGHSHGENDVGGQTDGL